MTSDALVRGIASTASSKPADFYAAAILREAPRVLGLLDRESMSPTVGCADRTFWAWKFVDFPASRLQEAVCVLAYLYATPLPESPYYHRATLLEWIDNALRFWARLQHRDGSFDEAYPFERSLAATAFGSFYVGEALELVGDVIPVATRTATRETLARAGEWLTANDETHGFLSNHLAAAAGALAHIQRQTGDAKFQQRSQYFLDRILQRQSPEGWYDQYGGADPGYQTHGSFYMARCWQFSGDDRLLASLSRAAAFIAHFIHADGSIGGEYTSRNTQTFYPAAYEMLAHRDPVSAWIAESMRPSLATGAAASLRGIDLFNYFPCLNNFVFAHRACEARGDVGPAPSDPFPDAGTAWFPLAGFMRVRSSGYDAYIGTAKGGVIKLFDRPRRRLVFSDCGYVGQLDSGALVSSQYQDASRPTRLTDSTIEVDGQLMQFARPTMTPVLFVGFRLFTLTVGRLPGLARWLKTRLVKTLIYRRRSIQVNVTRHIEFDEREIRVRDTLQGPDGARLSRLRWEQRFTTIHMGSSRYFVANELAWDATGQDVDHRAVATGVVIERSGSVGQD